MRILIAPDKFKHTLTALAVCDALAAGIESVLPAAEIVKVPLADGGEGTAEILTHLAGGRLISVNVCDPLFRAIHASYGVSADGATAFIEMASASGLHLLKPAERNPLHTSTYGTGQLIRHALLAGVKTVVLGIGGSATNDAGMGLATALGFKFVNDSDQELIASGANTRYVNRIDTANVMKELKGTTVIAMCDVQNPFIGPTGAAFTYGPQKGASQADVVELDDGLKNFAQVIERDLSKSILTIPGAGAGGGIGGGAIAFLDATLQSGIEYVLHVSHMERKVEWADVIITGEGRLDSQTSQGKVIAGIAALAHKHTRPLIAVTGKNELTTAEQKDLHVDAVFSLTDVVGEQEAMDQPFEAVRKIGAEGIANYLKGIVIK